ncbi:hypothetical protein [uncultured Chitinophaga sp.]|uniref:putative polyvalent protein kinase domain-containing protein n=1 Tax=uncultured Chitinophaga sp. TaxID=339340 RepID=UPI003452936D
MFPSTTCQLPGFAHNREGAFSIVWKQPFIEGGQADLANIKELPVFNGFRISNDRTTAIKSLNGCLKICTVFYVLEESPL